MGMSGLSTFIVPRIEAGTEIDTQKRRGVFTLTANTTYYYIFGGAASPTQHIQITGYTAGLIITTATVQTCSQPVVTDTSVIAGEWISEDPAAGDVRTDGAGWSSSAAVVSADGSAVGGASWHLIDWSPARTRLAVAVGATGGDLAVAWMGKE